MTQLYTLTKTKNLTMDILGTPEHQPAITGDVMEFGLPSVGNFFHLANQNGPVADGEGRLYVFTSRVQRIIAKADTGLVFGPGFTYTDHSIVFQTRNSEYRLDWREIL